MNLREAYQAGYNHGWSLASWNDIPEIGTKLAPEIDWVGTGDIETVEDQLEAWEQILHAANEHCRQFSPFEQTAHELNSHPDPERAWEVFDRATEKAWADYRRKHYPIRGLRKAAKEKDQRP